MVLCGPLRYLVIPRYFNRRLVDWVHCGACAVFSDKIKLWVSNTVLLTVFALYEIFIVSVDALGARESCGHLEKCIALSDVYDYKQTHCFVLVNKN